MNNWILRFIQFILVIFGLGLLFVGIGADLLLDGNPGFSTMQLMATLAGAIMIGVALLLAIPGMQNRLSSGLGKNFGKIVLIVVISLVVALVAVEIVLAITGYQPHSLGSAEADAVYHETADWWTCEDNGCHFIQDAMQIACDNGEVTYEQYCMVNAQGFYSPNDYVASETLDNADYRIMLLGDSFTWGFSSTVGNSWAEVMEKNLDENRDLALWNMGIGGTGTNQAWLTLQQYAPIMQPDMLILGFYPTNDYSDNAQPLDKYVVTPYAISFLLYRYKLNEDLSVTERSATELGYRVRNLNPPTSDLEYLVRTTRVGSLLANSLHNIVNSLTSAAEESVDVEDSPAFRERSIELTREYLTDIRDYAAEQDTEFMILLIPDRDMDFSGEPSQNYQTTRDLLTELGIPYLDPLSILDANADYDDTFGKHWNDIGHHKIGDALSECMEAVLDDTPVAECHALMSE